MTSIVKRKTYISGPMTGVDGFNYPTFHAAAMILRRGGHDVYNPADWAPAGGRECPTPYPLADAFEDHFRFLLREANTIAMLPGWQESKGAQAEYWLAVRMGLDVIELGTYTAEDGSKVVTLIKQSDT